MSTSFEDILTGVHSLKLLLNKLQTLIEEKHKLLAQLDIINDTIIDMMQPSTVVLKKKAMLGRLPELSDILGNIKSCVEELNKSLCLCFVSASYKKRLIQYYQDLRDFISPSALSSSGAGGNSPGLSNGAKSASMRNRASTVIKLSDGNIANILEMIQQKRIPLDTDKVVHLLDGKLDAALKDEKPNELLRKTKALESKGHYVEALYGYLGHRVLMMQQPGSPSQVRTVETAVLYNKLAVVAYRQDAYDKALLWYEKELEIRGKLVDDTDVSLAPGLQALGDVNAKLGKLEVALAKYKMALKIRNKHLGDHHPTVAATLLSIGRLHHDQKRLDDALYAYNKALDCRQAKHGPNHPGVASIYNSIGELYAQHEKYNEALAFHNKSLKIRQIKLGSSHLDLATSHHNMADVYAKLQQHDDAVSSYRQSHNIRKNKLGAEHVLTVMSKSGMQAAQSKQMRPAEAVRSSTGGATAKSSLSPKGV